MRMKDKTEKYNHKRNYYKIRKITLFGIASLSFISIVAIPTYIISNFTSAVETKADENTNVEEETLTFLNYEE